jgi:dimethylargininase
MIITKAIVRTPGQSIVRGITNSDLGSPDYNRALDQHRDYISALRECGLEIIVLEPLEEFPDSVFVEDTALITPHCAVITRPGSESRRDETRSISSELALQYQNIEYIRDPGTVDAGDIMMVGRHFYIGISERTNTQGACQMITILEEYGLTATKVKIQNILHLKSSVSYLENNSLLLGPELLNESQFQNFNRIEVDPEERYAANCIWVNDIVLVPAGFPKTLRKLELEGFKTIEVDVTEFQKLDGGLSCLSLRMYS